jgi:signal transduction histidine kinase/ligand-binding sensor domain-containing protein
MCSIKINKYTFLTMATHLFFMKKILFPLLLIFSLNAYAQNQHPYFEHLNVAEGLPEDFITALHQDKLGYIWIGTQNGLVRYDGYRLKVYKLGAEKINRPKVFSIASIEEDSDGILWICTAINDVYRYNRTGDNFRQYKLDSNYSAISDPIKAINDEHGHIWICAESPLLLFYNEFKTEKLKMADTFTGSVTVFPYIATSGLLTSAGSIWFGTDKGLICYNQTTHKMGAPVLPATLKGKGIQVFNLCQPHSMPGILWFNVFDDNLKSYGLFSFDMRTKLFRQYNSASKIVGGIATDTVYTIQESRQNKLWFGTNRGLSLFDKKTGRFTNYTPPAIINRDENPVTSIVESNDGQLWLGTPTDGKPSRRYGLMSFDLSTGRFQRYLHNAKDPSSLSADFVTNLLVDRSGILWAGTGHGGLNRLNNLRSQFMGYRPVAGDLNSYPINGGLGIVQTPDKYCWIGSKEGLIKWKPNTDTFTHVKLPGYLKKDVNVLATDKEGLVWCSSRDVRIFTYNSKTGITDTLKIAGKWPGEGGIVVMYQDRSGLIWIGTNRSGLYSYRKGDAVFKNYPSEEKLHGVHYSGKKLDHNSLRSLYEDKRGVFWLGTSGGGLNRFNRSDDTFTSYYDLNKGLADVLGICEDITNRLWVGTYLNGLFLFNRNTGTSSVYTEAEGLLSNNVRCLLADTDGRIWMITDRGINMMDPAKSGFTSFSTKNALPFNYNYASHTLALRTPENEIVAAFTEGLIAFYPDKLYKNITPPIVHIESLAYNDPQDNAGNIHRLIVNNVNRIELPHNQNRIAFNYIALHYANPAENRYAYKLSGYDKNWVQAGSQRSVTYTNLAPGNYTFSVKAANSDGIWNEAGASIKITIYPPWWFTWWALIFYIIVFAGTLYWFINFRARKLRQENQLLEEKVTQRTQQLVEVNKELEEQHEEIVNQRDNLEQAFSDLKITQTQLVQSEKMTSLGELTAGIAHEIQNPLNFVNNFSEVNKEMIAELKEELKNGNLEDVLAIATDIEQNEQKINHHGKRADAIVKGMLEHSRVGRGEKQLTDINKLADEYLRLAYHGLRAKDKHFNAELTTNFDETLPMVNAVQQDISRVLLNLFNNSFYAVNEKKKTEGDDYKPDVTVSTSSTAKEIEIKVKDNGNGIPDAIKNKIMQPFFTTKPTGEGTGLGLSLSYDIIVKGYGGSISFDSKESEGAEFVINIPI